MFKKKSVNQKNFLNPTRIIFLSFLLVIFCGTLLLKLPQSTNSHNISFINALYTSTSAVCVTGLIVVDTATYFTRFGQTVIMILIQIGGLGIMTFSLLFIVLLSKKLTVKNTILASEITGHSRLENINDVLKYVFLFTFMTELIGFLLLLIKFINYYPLKKAIFFSLFHSISAFCNAGFSTFSDSLIKYSNDLWINFIIMSLIILGGIGFVVVIDIKNFFTNKKKNIYRLTLHTKLVLITTAILILFGTLFFFILEYNNVLKNDYFSNKLLKSLFQSVTCRTAGFNTIDISKLSPAALFVSIFLMYIGGSPSSTAGGIKTTTFAVLFLTVIAMIKDKNVVEVYKKRLAQRLIHKTVAIITISVITVIIITTTALYLESSNVKMAKNGALFSDIFFETASALGTVGLSTGITGKIKDSTKILYILAMFIGRLGPLSFALAIVKQKDNINYSYPEDKVLLG